MKVAARGGADNTGTDSQQKEGDDDEDLRFSCDCIKRNLL